MAYDNCPFPILRLSGFCRGLPLVWMLGAVIASAAVASKHPSAPAPQPLYVSKLLDVARSAGEAGKTGHAYPAMEKLLGLPSEAGRMTAFEENRFFVYGAARFRTGATGGTWHRRILFLKPSTFIIDDEGLARRPTKPATWQLYQPGDRAARSEVWVETLLPENASRRVMRCKDRGCYDPANPFVLEVVPRGTTTPGRFLHVVEIPVADRAAAKPPSRLVKADGLLQLTLQAGPRILRWSKPDAGDLPGDIEIASADGSKVLGVRPLPSGILPHTPEGMRLLEVWDGDYRDGRHPKWDTGKPSADLVKAIEDGVFKPGRVVEFGSGTGTDAVYMASKGFDVTAIDISPSAVAQAREKAKQAGVEVRFLLADALNPPEIGQFDYIYDRACYHEVRSQNLEAYLATLRKVSRPGTRLLLIAGNSNGPDLGFGPPTVTEEELRFDFTPLFDIEWLRESRFEVFPPGAGFPLAWAALLRRKAD
jgi:SAM-dependent methyltransferase